MSHNENQPREAELLPIQNQDLDRVCRFYHAHLNATLSPMAWRRAFDQPWIEDKPNNGYMLVDGGEVVGVFGGIYSQRIIRGKMEKFCNHSSWMVLDAYRRQSLSLLTAMLEHTDHHITSLTPNPDVAEICAYMGGFKLLSNHITIVPNMPWRQPFSTHVEGKPHVVKRLLEAEALRDFENHRPFSWLGQVVVGQPGDYCHVVFKKKIWKKIPSAVILHLSAPESFLRHYRTLGYYLLTRHFMGTMHIPTRFLPAIPRLSWHTMETQPRMYISDSLGEGDHSFLYTEVTALNLRL